MRIFLSALVLAGCIQSAFSTARFRTRFYGVSQAPEVYEEPEFHAAVRAKNKELFEQLLPLQEDLNTRNSRGQSPLSLAVGLSEVDMAEVLLEKGAQLDLSHPKDQQALKYARPPMKKLLKKYKQTKGFCPWLFKK